MSQLEGGRSQAAFIRSGGGTIQRQNLLSLDVNPLRVAPPVSTSANQLDQLNQTISAAASTIAQGGRYADWLRQKREAEAEAQRRANEENQRRIDAIASATSKIDEANGSVVGKAFRQQYLIDIESGALAVPQELSGVDKAMWVRDQAIAAAREKYGTQATDAFVSGVAKELDPDVFLKEADQRLKTVQVESANKEIASRSNTLVKVGDLSLIPGVVEEAVNLIPPSVRSPESVRKEIITPAMERAASEGEVDKVAALTAALGGAEAKWSADMMDKAVKEKQQRENDEKSMRRQTALTYLTDQIDVGERYDPGIVDYIEFAFEKGALTVSDRKEYLGRVKSMAEKAAEQQQRLIDERTANNLFQERVIPNLGKIASGSWWDAGDVEVKVGGTSRKATLAEQRRMAYEAAAANVDNVEGLAPEERSRLKLQVAFRQNYMPDEIPAKATANVQQMQAFGLPVAGPDKVVVTPAMQETVAIYQEGNKLSPSWAAGMFANDNDRAYMNSIVEYLGSNTNDLKGAISYANNVRTAGQVDAAAVDSATKSIIDDYDFVGGEIGAHIMREARLNMGAGVSAKKAVELAKELVKSRLVTINGYSTYVYDRNFNEQDQKALNRGVRAWFEHVAKNYGSRPENLGGIGRDKPLTADDMRLRQDRNGMWVVLDARDGRGKIVATGDDLMLSAMTTKEVMDMQMLADNRAIRAEAEAERARKDRRSVDISASSDTGSGTY